MVDNETAIFKYFRCLPSRGTYDEEAKIRFHKCRIENLMNIWIAQDFIHTVCIACQRRVWSAADCYKQLLIICDYCDKCVTFNVKLYGDRPDHHYTHCSTSGKRSNRDKAPIFFVLTLCNAMVWSGVSTAEDTRQKRRDQPGRNERLV